MRVGLLTLLGLPMATYAVAFADPVEGSGFAGVSYFHNDSGLGDSPTQMSVETAPQFGARLTLLPWRTPPTEVGGELELSYIHSSAGDTSVPILAYRGLVMVRLSQGLLRPHLEVGAGAETITTTSVITRRDTDFALITGAGFTIPIGDKVHLRADVRQNWMESLQGGWAAMYEFQAGIGGTFGAPRTRKARPTLEAPPPIPTPTIVKAEPPPSPPPLDNKDTDNDGIVDRLDKCPAEKEDLDQNEDSDGCPELDDDHDGIADAVDKCPLQPETFNGINDKDGCPDELPEKYVTAFAAASQVAFEKDGVRLSASAKASLDKTAILLMTNPKLRVSLTVHPEANSEAATALATKRMNAVKWYLTTDQGVAAKQLETKIGSVSQTPPIVEVALVPSTQR